MNKKICKIDLFYNIVSFKNIVIKLFFQNNKTENVNKIKSKK